MLFDATKRQRMGEDLDGMDIEELRGLEQNLDEALKVVRNRKVRTQSSMAYLLQYLLVLLVDFP